MIIVPYTRLHPATARLLNKHAPGHRRVKLDPADMSAYWRLLAACWLQLGELIIVEHDIGIAAGTLPGFAACPEPWCAFGYAIDGSVAACLGCARFSASLKAAEPDLLEEVGADATAGLPARDWRRLDVRILDALRKRGYEQHRHHPDVRHYHRYAAR